MIKSLEFLKKPINFLSSPEKKSERISDLGNPAAWLTDFFGGRATLSGEQVGHETAMALDSYFAAIRNISEDIAKLPFNIFQIVDNGEKLVTNQPAQRLLHNYANPNTSTMDLVQTIVHWALSYGNGFAEIVRNSRGQAVELWPIHPSRIVPIRDEDQNLFWEVRGTFTSIRGEVSRSVILKDENVFNLRGLGADGIIGYSVFQLASDSIGQGLGTQKFASAYYGNATSLSGALVAPGKLSPDQYQNLRESWNKLHSGGAKNKHQVAILEAGLVFQQMSSNAKDAQLLDAQKFTVERMARLLRIPPHKIGHASGLVKANFEAESISYFRDTLTPWIKRISLETDLKIIQNVRFTARHEVNALALGDSQTVAGVVKTLRNTGLMSVNEGRRITGLSVSDIPGSDDLHMQSNITTLQNITEGSNLKAKGPGQMGSTKNEQGEPKSIAAEPLATDEPIVIVDPLAVLEEAKVANLPSFKYAAKRIVTKETKQLAQKLKTFAADDTGFDKWADHFFDKQKADVIDVFDPCCQVFSNTFAVEGVAIELDFLTGFSDNYAEDGKRRASDLWKSQSKGDDTDINIDDEADKMANSVINKMASHAKGLENDTE